MRPAEIVTVAAAVPLVAALLVAQVAEGVAGPTASSAAVQSARMGDVAPAASTEGPSNEVVVIARRHSRG